MFSRNPMPLQPVLNLQQQAGKASGALPALMLAADQVAKAVQSGAHGRRRAGFGDAFWQFRDYQTQESATRIDWRQSAKRDKLAVREHEWSAVQTAYLWLDDTASMDFKSAANVPYSKLDGARVLALALANLMMRGGESIGSLDRAVKPGASKQKAEELADWLLKPRDQDLPQSGAGRGGGNTLIPTPIPTPTPTLAYAQQVWFSDFLMPTDDLKASLLSQTKNRQRGVLVQIVDPSEFSLPYTGRTKFTGLEGEADWTVQKTEGVKDLYATRWREHCDNLNLMAKAAGWSLVQVNTGEVLTKPLTKLFGLLTEGSNK